MTSPLRACIDHAVALLIGAVASANERRSGYFDPVRGLYATEPEVADILANAVGPVREAPHDANGDEFTVLGLNPFESCTLALATASAVVPRIDRVIGFLHDDLSRKDITVGLLLELLCKDLEHRESCLAMLAPSALLRWLSFLDSN